MEISMNDGYVFDVQTEALGHAIVLAQQYYADRQVLADEENTAKANYAGSRLQAELQRIHDEQAALKPAALKAITAQFDGIKATIVERQAAVNEKNAQMGVDALTDDYKYLSLPVTLSTSELERLITRNADNHLFVRAAQEYAASHGLDINVPDTSKARLQAASDAAGALLNAVQTDNATMLSIFTKNCLPGIDAVLAAPEGPIKGFRADRQTVGNMSPDDLFEVLRDASSEARALKRVMRKD